MKKVLIYGSAVVVAFALVAAKLNNNQKHNEERSAIVRESTSGAVPVQVDTVSVGGLNQSFSENGNFEAVNQIELTSEVAGRIKELYVKEGSVVKAGQALARIDNEILNADRSASQAKLSQAKQNLSRYEQALQTGGVTQKQVDDARLEVETAQAHFVQVNKNLGNALVKAPANGIINKRFVEVGSYLSPGGKLFEIVDGSKLQLTVYVSELEVVKLQTGNRVNVTASVFPEAVYEGKITFISAKGDAALNYPVEIEIQNIAGKELKAGMYGTATFSSINKSEAMLIPRSAFYGGINSQKIFVLNNDKAKLREVITGRSYGEQVEIRGGLKEGEIIITSGQINLVDGTRVSVQQ
jgi:membrane fusion protein (multidrug efflux system)